MYDNPLSGLGASGLQRNRVITTDDGAQNQSRAILYRSIRSPYHSHRIRIPRLLGTFKKRRRTEYAYPGFQPSCCRIHRPVTLMTGGMRKRSMTIPMTRELRNGPTMTTRTSGGRFKVLVPPGCRPPRASPAMIPFVGASVRGLVTKVLRWSNATALPDISRHQYDIFWQRVKSGGQLPPVRGSTSARTSTICFLVPVSITDERPGPTDQLCI
jgi:hypothetical protein